MPLTRSGLLVKIVFLSFLILLPLNSQASLLDRKVIWAHNIPVFTLGLHSQYLGTYGSAYPLEIGDDNQTAVRTIRTAKQAGIDAFAVDTMPNMQQVIPFLSAADTVNKADGSNFLIAPTIDLSASTTYKNNLQQGYLDYVNAYCIAATGHDSAARVNNELVVFTYTKLDVASWNAVRSQVACPIYWVGNLPFNYVNGSPTITWLQAQTKTAISDYGFDAYYGFGDLPIPSGRWDAVAGVLKAAGKPFLGGMFPGYYRGFGISWPYGPFNTNVDMQATQHYRDAWQNVLSNHLPWMHIATWNDFAEHTDLDPDTDLGSTRSDLTAWYASQFKGTPFNLFTTAKLYITTPQALYQNEPGVAEGLVINPTDNTLNIHLEIRYSDGRSYGTASASVGPHQLEAASFAIRLANSPPSRFLKATVFLDTSPTQQVTSAPIFIYPVNEPDPSTPTGIHSTPQYYSLRADKVLPANPSLTVADNQATAVGGSGTTPRLMDILLDTNHMGPLSSTVQNLYSVTPLQAISSASTNDNYYTLHYGLSYGLYVVREVDSQNRIGYSEPVIAARSSPAVTAFPNLDQLRVYPNPWRTDKHAGFPITFDRLSPNSTIQIFTVSSHLTKSLTAASSTVAWDLTNTNGMKVASGVYLYIAKDNQGNQTKGKLVILR